MKYFRLNVFNYDLISDIFLGWVVEHGLKYFAAGCQNTFVSLKMAPMKIKSDVA